jgi:hypothetical protein
MILRLMVLTTLMLLILASPTHASENASKARQEEVAKRGGIFAFRASSSLYTGRFGSRIGSTVRSGAVCAAAVAAQTAVKVTLMVVLKVLRTTAFLLFSCATIY